MSIIVFNPTPNLFDRYKKKSNIIYYNDDGWWIVENNKRVCKGKCDEKLYLWENGIHSQSIKEIINEIRKFGPLWSRWVTTGDQYELLYREALFYVLEVRAGLKCYGIKSAIFNTGVTHHISTMIFEIACALENVKQVFLYTNNIMLGRLLPLVQEKSIIDRKPLDVKLSNQSSNDYIDRFLKNKLKGGSPECGGDLPKRREESLLFAILQIFKELIRSILRPLKRYIVSSNDNTTIFNKYYYYNSLDHFRQIMQQYSSLSFYNKNIDTKIIATVKKHNQNRLLIAAHFQPEATSFPEGWDMHNHVDIALELRRLGYSDEILYKEHPASFMYTAEIVQFTRVGMCRSRSYYEQLLQIGCKFIAPSTELPVCSENSWFLPITITGTIAVERSLMGLHTIVTGYPWYKGLPGTIHLEDIDSLTELKSEWVTPDEDLARKARSFLTEILDCKTMTNILGFGTGIKSSDTNEVDNFRNEFNSLLDFLQK